MCTKPVTYALTRIVKSRRERHRPFWPLVGLQMVVHSPMYFGLNQCVTSRYVVTFYLVHGERGLSTTQLKVTVSNTTPRLGFSQYRSPYLTRLTNSVRPERELRGDFGFSDPTPFPPHLGVSFTPMSSPVTTTGRV